MGDMEEKTNFLRIMCALNAEGRKCLKKLLETYIVGQTSLEHSSNLIFEESRPKLPEVGKIDALDITDLHAALHDAKRVTPDWQGWGDEDRKWQAAASIKMLHNDLFHRPTENVSNEDFRAKMEKLKDDVNVLGDGSAVEGFETEDFGSPAAVEALIVIMHDSKRNIVVQEQHHSNWPVLPNQAGPAIQSIHSLTVKSLKMKQSNVLFSTTPREIEIEKMEMDTGSVTFTDSHGPSAGGLPVGILSLMHRQEIEKMEMDMGSVKVTGSHGPSAGMGLGFMHHRQEMEKMKMDMGSVKVTGSHGPSAGMGLGFMHHRQEVTHRPNDDQPLSDEDTGTIN